MDDSYPVPSLLALPLALPSLLALLLLLLAPPFLPPCVFFRPSETSGPKEVSSDPPYRHSPEFEPASVSIRCRATNRCRSSGTI